MKVCFSFRCTDITQMFYLFEFISNSMCCFNSSGSQNPVCSLPLLCGQVYVRILGVGKNVLCCGVAQVVKYRDVCLGIGDKFDLPISAAVLQPVFMPVV